LKTRVYSPTPANLRRLARDLQRGGLVAIPTETVYGLAANALDARACQAIFAAKGRPTHDPLIVHVLDLLHAEELAEFNATARQLTDRFWPGPLTLVLRRKIAVPDIVTAARDTVAIRSPDHPVARKILQLAGVPLAAPSANLFGYISPTSADHVLDGLAGRIPSVIDGGPTAFGVESTILDVSDPARPALLRPGIITAAMLEKFLGVAIHFPRRKRGVALLAPGMLPRHYSPRTPLVIKNHWRKTPPEVAGIFLRKPTRATAKNVHWLSERGSLGEVAHNLYKVLREVDGGRYRQIWIEALKADSGGLATALVDRITRAAAKA